MRDEVQRDASTATWRVTLRPIRLLMFGNFESSRKMKAVWPLAGRQVRELVGRTSWRSAPPFEFNLVAERDPTGARGRDLGLQLAAAVIDGAAMHGGQGRWTPFPVREHAPVVPGCGYRVSD